jgi:alpha-mannosidase
MGNPSGHYGIAVLNDCKYGWDHPDPQTLRLSLIHTPGVFERWNWVGDQSSQDMGRHEFKFALIGHSGDWRDGNIVVEAANFNQPLLGFYAPEKIAGKLGKSFSFAGIQSATKNAPSPSIVISALKKAENSNDIVVRLRETAGKQVDIASVAFATPVTSASEVNGQEDHLGVATVQKGALNAGFTPYQPRAFALSLSPSKLKTPDKPRYLPLKLDYNLDGISMEDNKTDGDLDGHGNTLAGELLPDTVWFQGIPFVIGPKTAGAKNVMICSDTGAVFSLVSTAHVHLLVAALDGGLLDTTYLASGGAQFGEWARVLGEALSTNNKIKRASLVTAYNEKVNSFKVDEKEITLPGYFEPIGSWNNRLVNGKLAEVTDRIAPPYFSPVPVAWYSPHYHSSSGRNSIYQYTYLYEVTMSTNQPKSLNRLLRSNLRILAATAGEKPMATSAQPLHDSFTASIARIAVNQTAFVDSAVVTLSSPNVGAELHYTLDGSAPTEQSTKYDLPFAVTDSRTIKARAFVPGVERDYVSSLSVQKLLPHAAVSVTNTLPGLSCKYYEGNWDKLPNFDSLKVLKDTITDTIAVPLYAADSLYGLVMRGYITVPSEGMYEFGLSSDDGSKLWIGDSLVVDNDGLHGSGELPGQIALKAGVHPITLKMFQCKGDEALDLWITGPGLPKQIVPRTMLSRDVPVKKRGKR